MYIQPEMMNLAIAKWGNSLAIRIPADYVRRVGIREGDHLEVHLAVDGALNLRPAKWSRKAFAGELRESQIGTPPGTSVMEILREEARY